MAKRRWISRAGWIVGGLGIAALCGPFLLLGWNLAQVGWQLEAQGVVASATIVAKNERSRLVNPKSGQPEYAPEYFVTYGFAASDGTHSISEARVSATFFRRMSIGAVTPVRYLPDNHKRSEVEFGSIGSSSLGGLLGGGLGVALGLGLVLVAVVRPRLLAA